MLRLKRKEKNGLQLFGWALLVAVAAPLASFAQDDETEIPEQTGKTIEETTEGESTETIEDEIVVTGTSLELAPSQVARQVIVITREELVATGEPTMGRALARVPQNFGALGDTVYSQSDRNFRQYANGAANVGAAVTMNLRGLGNDATLVLVNGRRMGESGLQGGLQDISSIPMSFIERIEIITDGASAIYGADAVGGVVNIITRKYAETLTTEVRYTAPTSSGNNEINLDLTAGKAWGSGNVVASLSLYNQTNLSRADLDARYASETGIYIDHTRGSFSPIGPNSNPGSVYLNDDRTFYVQSDPDATTVAGMDDLAPLRFDEFGSFPINPIDLAPKVENLSLNVVAQQELSEGVVLNGRLSFTDRHVDFVNGYPQTLASLEADNPLNPTFGRDPNGPIAPQRISVRGYYPALGLQGAANDNQTYSLNVGLDVEITEEWDFSAGVSYARSDYDYAAYNQIDLFNVNKNGWFNPWGNGMSMMNDIVTWTDAFGNEVTGTVHEYATRQGNPTAWSENQNVILDAKVRGELFNLPAGPVRAILGVELRDDTLRGGSYYTINTGGQTETDQGGMDASQDAMSGLVEVFVPLLRDKPLARDLSLQAAFRTERHESGGYFTGRTGSDTLGEDPDVIDGADGKTFDADTWMAGLVWSPAKPLLFKANRNTSFLAPDVTRLFQPTIESDRSTLCGVYGPILERFLGPLPYDPSAPYPENPLNGCLVRTRVDGSLVSFLNPDAYQASPYVELRGGNPFLKPQRGTSTSFTMELDVTDDLLFRVNWWETEYRDKFADLYRTYFRRVTGDFDLEATFPDVFEYHENGDVSAIKTWEINMDRQEVRGIDYALDFRRETPIGEFRFRPKWTANLKNEAQLLPDPRFPVTELVGIEVPKHNGAVSVGWRNAHWNVGLDSSYRGETYSRHYFRDGKNGAKYEELWRSNLTVSYEFGAHGGILDGITLTAGITNLFDEEQETALYKEGELVLRTELGAAATFNDPRSQTFFFGLRREF